VPGQNRAIYTITTFISYKVSGDSSWNSRRAHAMSGENKAGPQGSGWIIVPAKARGIRSQSFEAVFSSVFLRLSVA